MNPDAPDMTPTIEPVTPPAPEIFRVHDGIYDPIELIAHCDRMRADIAERQKDLIDIPV